MPLQDYDLRKMPEAKPYGWDPQSYYESGQITMARGCTGFMAINQGDRDAEVGGILIRCNIDPITNLPLTGDSITIAAGTRDVFKGGPVQLKILPGAGVSPRVDFVQIFYSDLEHEN